MAFEQVRLFEITGFDSETGKPTISNTPISFWLRELQSRKLTISRLLFSLNTLKRAILLIIRLKRIQS